LLARMAGGVPLRLTVTLALLKPFMPRGASDNYKIEQFIRARDNS
jgi:hypothetical protein